MRDTPSWTAMETVARALVYDCTISNETTSGILAAVPIPTLVLDREGSSEDITGSATAALPSASHRSLAGGWRSVPGEDLAPVLIDFFTADGPTSR